MCKFKSSRFVFLVQARALASHAFSDVFRLLLLHLSWRLFISISLIAHSRPQILEQTTMKSIEELWFDDHFSEPSLHYVQTIGRFLIPYFDMLIRDAVAEVDPGTVLAYLCSKSILEHRSVFHWVRSCSHPPHVSIIFRSFALAGAMSHSSIRIVGCRARSKSAVHAS